MKMQTRGELVLTSGLNQPTQTCFRHFPVGAESGQGGTHFRVWAPKSRHVVVRYSSDPELPPDRTEGADLESEAEGYFSGLISDARPGMYYKFELDQGCFPDPASRFQPLGPHGPSQIIDPAQFQWTDESWKGVTFHGQVLYEMHIGTFTGAGTWKAAEEELPELADLGVTVIELMPVADFCGRFGWGYDGVNLFAPTRLHGAPDDFRRFVDRAHSLGLGVILDVVYNHLGPDGSYLTEFSDHYLSDRYKSEWGQCFNFDGEHNGPVREFFLTNAAYWIREFHMDGLRLDATQQMFDSSAEHVIVALSKTARTAAGHRSVYFVAENEPQNSKLVLPLGQGGYGLDAIWNDDFHHSALTAVTGHNDAYYTDYRGTPQEFISAAKRGFLYQGQWYSWQQKPRGSSTAGIESARFINFIQNHDQVANSLHGRRIHASTSPGRLRALVTLLLIGPGTPMIFQGQEFSSSSPFLYFADQKPELARLVAKGRRQFLSQFRAFHDSHIDPYLADPANPETFIRSKLDFSERIKNSQIYAVHRDLLRLRREDPVFSRLSSVAIDGAVLGPEAFVLRFFCKDNNDRLLLVNFGLDLSLNIVPEPLLAPCAGSRWRVAWSSEDPAYGGNGTPPLESDAGWLIPGHAAVVVVSESTSPEGSSEASNGAPKPGSESAHNKTAEE